MSVQGAHVCAHVDMSLWAACGASRHNPELSTVVLCSRKCCTSTRSYAVAVADYG